MTMIVYGSKDSDQYHLYPNGSAIDHTLPNIDSPKLSMKSMHYHDNHANN